MCGACVYVFIFNSWLQKSGEVVDCPGFDCDFSEAKGCVEGCLQEQKVPAP